MSADPVFTAAAEFFVDLVGRIGPDDWDRPGLGDWDVRSLVGHTSRSLVTVSQYLGTPASREDAATPPDYYGLIRAIATGAGTADINERGRAAGRDLGPDPAAAVRRLADTALADIAAVGNPLLAVIGGIGIRLHTYLPTRVFELAVHGIDIARAVGIDVTPAPEVLSAALSLAADIAVRDGAGAAVLTALTGRTGLADGFSVV